MLAEILNTLKSNEFKTQLEELAVLSEAKINVFDALGMNNQETKHSRFLAWLMDSQKPHRLKNAKVLALFMKYACEYQTKPTKKDLKSLNGSPTIKQNVDILCSIFHIDDKDKNNKDKLYETICDCLQGKFIVDPEVYAFTENGEKGYIDILVTFPQTKTVIAIENKVFTTTHSNQLCKYQKFLDENNKYTDYKKIYILLSPYGELPINRGKSADNNYNNNWCVIDYYIVKKVIQDVFDNLKKCTIGLKSDGREKLKWLLGDYMSYIDKNIFKNNKEMFDECKGILDNSTYKRAFEMLKLYTDTATEVSVIDYCLPIIKENISACAKDGYNVSPKEISFCTPAIKNYFKGDDEEFDFEKVCHCFCGTDGNGNIIGIVEFLKQNGEWSDKQKKYLTKYLPKKLTQTSNARVTETVYVSPESERVEILDDIKEDIKNRIVRPQPINYVDKPRKMTFKEIIEKFEQELQTL